MNDRQLIADLLSALEYHTEQTRPIEFSRVAIEAARQALAEQPAHQEPVAWLDPWTRNNVTTDYDAYGKHGIPLYTSPPASKLWVGLTDDEILYCVELENPKAIAEEVEAKLKEKNA